MLKISKKQFFVFSLFTILFLALSTNNALASGTSAFDKNVMTAVLCRVMNLVTGGIGKTFAAFAIIAMGVGFFSGKVSYAAMIGVTLGIAAMFGAPAIVNLMAGGDAFKCEDVISPTGDIL